MAEVQQPTNIRGFGNRLCARDAFKMVNCVKINSFHFYYQMNDKKLSRATSNSHSGLVLQLNMMSVSSC